MRLTFENGHFILECATHLKIAVHQNWETVAPTTFKTQSPQAAVKFKTCADAKALNILNKIFVRMYPLPTLPSLPFLDNHQQDGIRWILSRSRSYLAHAPGAGKTAQAIIASQLIKEEGRVLIICPPNLVKNWERELIKWQSPYQLLLPSSAVIPESAKQSEADWYSDYIICPDSMLMKQWVITGLAHLNFKMVIVDEADRYKESTSQRSIALFGGRLKEFNSPGLIYKPKHTVFLSGQPMPNRAMELWAPLYAASPETIDFQTQDQFGFKYCGAKMNERGQWEFKHTTNWEDLKARMQKKFMHIVTESQLGHPERRRNILLMSEDPRSKEMKAFEKDALSGIRFSDLNENMSQGDIAAYRRKLGLKKVTWIADYVRMRLENPNERILLFCWHRQVAIELGLRLHQYKPGLIIGGTSESAREDYKLRFKQNNIRLLIGNIQSMGVGHNDMQGATRVVFGEFSWTDKYNESCEKRASRKGSENKFVHCEYVVCPESMDEIVLNAVFTKAKNVKRVIG